MGHWLLEWSFEVFGETPFALRAPAAISGLLLVALTILYGRRVAGAGVGLLAGCVFDRIAPWPLFILAALVVARRSVRQLFGSATVAVVMLLACEARVVSQLIVHSRSTRTSECWSDGGSRKARPTH